MNERGPWNLARLHLPTGKRSDRVVERGETQLAGIKVLDRKSFLEVISACNAQQPGTWQYWEASRAPSYNSEIVATALQARGIVSPMTPKDIKRVTREIYRDEGLIAAVRFYRAAGWANGTGEDPGLHPSLALIRDEWGPAS